MKKFMAVYMGTTEAMTKWESLDEKTREEREQKGMKAWMAWGEKYASRVVENGGPLGKTKQVDMTGIKDIRNAMAAYVIVEAESHEAAAKMFIEHPHFAVFPGTSVEIMECLPLPEMD